MSDSTTIGDLMQKIVKMSGIDDAMLPIGRSYVWFGNSGQPAVIRLGEKSPFNQRMGVVAMFHNQDEVRVYAVPIDKPEKNEIPTPTRYTLSKTAPTFFVEALPQAVFEAEIADELSVLAGETANPDDFSSDPEDPEEEEDEPIAAVAEETATPAT